MCSTFAQACTVWIGVVSDFVVFENIAANIHAITRITSKDIRKFLDGVYVSHKGLAVSDD